MHTDYRTTKPNRAAHLPTIRARHPSRWSRHTLNWTPIETVALNPERDAVLIMAVHLASEKGYRLHDARDN